MNRSYIYIILFFLPLYVVAQSNEFPLPNVPGTLRTPEERANYLALHYWDNYDFSNNELIGNEDISEQGFSNFISIMPYVTVKKPAFEMFASRLIKNGRMLDYFMALGIKYLAESLSPLYDEQLYILLLEAVVAQPEISDEDREDFLFDLKMACKNVVGSKATDFGFLCRDGRYGKLSKVKGEYVLLFFGDPECDFCGKVKNELLASPTFLRFSKEGRLKVLSVCVEGKTEAWLSSSAPSGWIDACDEEGAVYEGSLYDIPGLPVLYLLDSEHRVLLKNVQSGQIESFLKGIE